MTPRPRAVDPKATVITFRVTDDIAEALRAIQERDGVPLSEQIRRGIGLWLESRGVTVERKRAATRRRS